MSTIFVSHAQADAACAETIRKGLEAKGYTVFREQGYPGPGEASYPHMIEYAILGSAALVLVWSSAASREAWVERHIHFAQRLHKLILPVALDGTPLPNTLIVDTVISCQPPCGDAAAQLLPHLAQLEGKAPLLKLCEEAATQNRNLSRKEAIEQADELLRRGEYRDELLAILEYLAKNDLMMGVRDKAQEALEADKKRATLPPPPPFLNLGDPRDIFGVQCGKCQHTTYFNKRVVCSPQAQVIRGTEEKDGVLLDKMELTCANCKHKIPTSVDCGGYR